MTSYISSRDKMFRRCAWAYIAFIAFLLGAVLGPPLGEKLLIGLFYLTSEI